MLERDRTVTSRDVARLAGVSQSSVSLVLNGGATRHGLSEMTQSRVFSAAEALGYTPNHAARSLRRQRSNTITFVTADLGNRYIAEVVTAAERAAHARGYVVNVVAARGEAAELAVVARLSNGAADGIVMHGGSPRVRDALGRLTRRGLACVFLQDGDVAGSVPCVRIDIGGGALLAMRHLIGLGHSRIAHVTDRRMRDALLNERLEGYRTALEAAGLGFDPDLVVAGENSFAGGGEAMHALMRDRQTRPTAVFVFNDQMAVGGLHALRSLGLAVPDDVAVVGFDGTELGAFTTPELTTIDHPRHDLGRLAVEAVFEQIDGRRDRPEMQALPVHLVIRQSCGGRRII